MDGVQRELRNFFQKQYGQEKTSASLQRDLVCTPYLGNHGTTAGWVVCMDGSPPKGTLLIMEFGPVCFYISADGSKCRRITGERQIEMMKTFYETHLEQADGHVILKAK